MTVALVLSQFASKDPPGSPTSSPAPRVRWFPTRGVASRREASLGPTAVAIGAEPSAILRKLLRVCFLARGLKSRIFGTRANGRLTLSAFYKRGSVNVRFAPKATQVLHCRELTRCANSGCEQSQQTAQLFDHLVGTREQSWRHFEAERLG